MAEPVLRAEVVSRRYGRSWAVRRVSATFTPGELTAIVGHNGAGKSTLLRLLSGLSRPTEGVVTAFDQPLTGFLPAGLRSRFGILGHSPAVYGDLTGTENLRLVAQLYRKPSHARALHAHLAAVDLELAADRAARTYSRGMVQRLAFARLMTQEATLWLLDEPTTGLDAGGRDIVLDAFRRAKARGVCILCVTHRPELLGDLVDRTLTLSGGRLTAPAADR